MSTECMLPSARMHGRMHGTAMSENPDAAQNPILKLAATHTRFIE